MSKRKNTDDEALAIFIKVPLVIAKNKGFVIVTFHDGQRVIGIYVGASHHISNSLSTKQLPNGSTLDLKDVLGNVTNYDIYTIKDLD